MMSFPHKTYATGVIESTGNMMVASAAERNKQPILEVIKNYLPAASTEGFVLEVASGTGQHLAHFAPHFPHVKWQPSDVEEDYMRSISAFIQEQGHKNILPPIEVNITKPIEQWANNYLKPQSCDMIYNSNMIHISPWATSLGLFKAAGYLLKPGGILFMYGPFKINGVLTPESNVNFDATLRTRDSSWGIRDTADLEQLANENGLKFEHMVDLPANNKCVIFRSCP